MNSFKEKYKTFANTDLLKIIDNPADYQPLAVEAAKAELAERKLTEDELEAAIKDNDVIRQESLFKNEKKKVLENKIKSIGWAVIDDLNPVQKSSPSVNKIIVILSLVFSAVFLFLLFTQFGFLKFVLTSNSAKWDITTLSYFLPIVLLPIATTLFWKRKKSGWVFLCFYIVYSAINLLALFPFIFRSREPVSILDDLIPVTSPATYLSTIVFWGGCLWAILKNNIRAIYNVDKRAMIKTILLSIVVTVALILLVNNKF